MTHDESKTQRLWSLSVGSFSLEHLSALALLRLSAQRAAVAIIEDDSLWDGLDEVLDAACRPGGEDPLGLAPLLRGTVLREVSDKVANQDILLQHGRQIQWLSASLPRPGDAPLLKGPVPMFLGGFLPEAVDAAQVISEAAGCQQNTPAFMELTEKVHRMVMDRGEAGYIRHAASRERRQAVRELTPLPYRALHFLMHSALLGQLFEHSGRFSGSLNLQSILEHLNADWDVMSVILESSPVAVLMDIARHLLFPTESDMSALSHLGDMSVSERKTWEKRLLQELSSLRRISGGRSWARICGERSLSMEAAEISQFSICSRCILFCEAVLEPALEPTSRADFEAQLDWGASLGDAKASLPLLLADRLAPPNLRMPAILSEQREETLHTGGESSPVPELLTMQGSILELGAGDLSFALSFARAQSGFERSADLTVTTLEHWQVVQTRYPSAAANRNAPQQGKGNLIMRDTVAVESRRQPWQIYAGKPAVLCCFVTPEAKRRRHAARAASAAATPAVPAATRAAPAEGAAGCRDEELKLGLGRMLRLVEKPTMNRLEREFQLSAELAAAHLAPILEFQRFLKRHLEFEVSRADANTWKLRDVLCSLRDASHSAESGEAGASHQSEAATFARNRKRFERFQSAWTACKQAGCMIRYGCKQLPEAPEMTLESPVSLCCPDETTDAGSFVLALVQSLVDRQNSFLKEVLAMASRDALGAAAAVRSVLEYWFHPGHVCLPIVGIEEEDHFAWMTGFGASGALCGWEEEMQADASELLVPGARCVFDWNLLEQERVDAPHVCRFLFLTPPVASLGNQCSKLVILVMIPLKHILYQEVAERLLQKAVQIDFRVENFNFPFKGEAFLNDYRFLEELHERVPQELSPDEPRACLMSTVKAAGLMASLQATIAAVRRLTPEPGLSLDDFCKNWFHGSHLQELLARKEATCRGLNVQHLVHLFELVEVQAAKDLAQEAGILLRIYIRWLTHGRLQPSEFIADYAERASRLMQPYQMDVKEIFGDLQLAHVQAALTFASNRCPTE
eukprot:g28098.t1